MSPKLVEVNADYKDFLEDALKAVSVVAGGFLLNKWRTGSSDTFDAAQALLITQILGLFVHHMIMDPYVLRFVVKSGQEGYYTARKRFG